MARTEEDLRALWQDALRRGASYDVERLVREILTTTPPIPLAVEVRYHRGVIDLTEGDGLGSQRLARAIAEFREGAKIGDQLGPSAEPWRSMNHLQLGTCLARVGNLPDAEKTLRNVAALRPYSITGHTALEVLADLLRQRGREADAARVDRDRLDYVRRLATHSPDGEARYLAEFILATELVDAGKKAEATPIFQRLASLGPDRVGPDIHRQSKAFLTE